MPDDPPENSPAPPPDDAAFLRWLATPQGKTAMQAVMQDTLDGKHGVVPAELRALAAAGLAQRGAEETVIRVVAAMQQLHETMQQLPEAWESRWRHVHGLHEQAKAVTDLILDVPEPQRTALMKLMLPLQEMLAKLERETK